MSGTVYTGRVLSADLTSTGLMQIALDYGTRRPLVVWSEEPSAFNLRPGLTVKAWLRNGGWVFREIAESAFLGESRVSDPPSDEPSRSVADLIGAECDALKAMLLAKNERYGNSALDPVRVFSRASTEEQIRVRLDDKLSRLMLRVHRKLGGAS